MGRNSKQQDAQQMRERRLQLEREEQEKQKRQNRLIWRTMIIVLAAILLIAGVGIAIGSCNQEKPVIDPTDPNYTAASDTTEYVRLTVTYTDSKNVYRQGEIVVQLYSEVAPITVENFQKLVGEGFYNGLTFHRIYQGFMIQGGDPKGDGTGGSTPIKGEFNENGVINNLSHKRGVISMARRGDDMDSGSSQFFIVHEDGNQLSLDGKYAGFGEVVSGMSTVDGIAGTAVTYGSSGEKSTPINPITILKAEFVQKVG